MNFEIKGCLPLEMIQLVHVTQTLLRGPRKALKLVEVEHDRTDCDPNNFNVDEIMKEWEIKRDSYITVYQNGELKRFYCDFDSCNRRYKNISHLNSHRKKKSHGRPKKKSDFEEVFHHAD